MRILLVNETHKTSEEIELSSVPRESEVIRIYKDDTQEDLQVLSVKYVVGDGNFLLVSLRVVTVWKGKKEQ